jgi:hypothetical protein
MLHPFKRPANWLFRYRWLVAAFVFMGIIYWIGAEVWADMMDSGTGLEITDP